MQRARWRLGQEVQPSHIAVAAVVGAIAALYLAAVTALRPPGPHEWSHADPILSIAPPAAAPWLVVAAGLLAASAWCALARPAAPVLAAGARQAALGVAVSAAIIAAMRLALGPSMPSFVPREESAAPGFALSMAAGYGEEVLFRLALAPLLYLVLRRRWPRAVAVGITALVTGLAFALMHEIGPGVWSPVYFATRLLFPGIAMTAAYLVAGPSFVVAAHCAAHVLMPALFR